MCEQPQQMDDTQTTLCRECGMNADFQPDLCVEQVNHTIDSLQKKLNHSKNWCNFISRREREIKARHDKRVKITQDKLYPCFPQEQIYDVIYLDCPWKYDKNTHLTNVPKYNTLSFNDLTYLPVRRIAKQDSILLMWATAPMLDKAISLIKLFGFRYVTVFQNWVKLQQGQPAKIKSSYSDASSEFLLWAEKGRTLQLRTPDIVPQILYSEITSHSAKPHDEIYKRLMLKLHLNKLKCLEIFAREKRMKYFDGYGDELEPKFQSQNVNQTKANIQVSQVNSTSDKSQNTAERVEAILSKVIYEGSGERMKQILYNYHTTFALSKKEIGKTPLAKHHIQLKEGAIPVRHNAYRCSPKEKEFLEQEIKMLENLDCIERCEATWVMPVIMVKKKDTTDLRMCIDYRSLNKEMIVENYPIPRVDDILNLLGKFSIYSKLDIKSGFWQIEIDEKSQQYTGFITPLGTFRWKRMPFGLKNAPATFQRIIEQALRSILGIICIVYIDDIIIFSNTYFEHVKNVQKVLSLLAKADLKVGVEKCEFFQKHIDILGHHITNGQVTPQAQKVKAIQDIPQPQNRSQVRSFVGMCSYYRIFIKHFSQKCEPLLKLTRQRSEFEWTPQVERSFQQMKKELCTSPMLATPTDIGQYILHTDFSELGLGAVLSQQQPKEETPRVVEYASRCLRGAEVNYPAYEGEVLAVHWALEKFRHYLHGVHFKLYTDNKALSQVLTSSTKSKKIIRWIMEMQEYDFVAEHRPGSDNANADALSRLIRIPNDVNLKLTNQINFISQQTFSLMNPGNRFDKENEVAIDLNFLSEGVGDLFCKICQSTHTKVPMLICECCGCGFHTTCIKWEKEIPKDAWYCTSCLQRNEKSTNKDITMDFDVLKYLQNTLDISTINEIRLQSIKIKASQFSWRYNRIYYIKNGQFLLVPTIAERKLLTLEQHRVLLHPSIQRLCSILKQNFYWPSMETLVQEITYNCQVCQARKHLSLPSTTYTPTEKGHHPWHTVSMDLAPELTITSKKNRHLLVLVDNFSKFTLLIPLKNKSSQGIATALFNNLICLFGTPKCFRMDQGSEFRGDVEDLAHRWGIKMQRATTYHPQANGMAEKMIDVVKRAVTTAINDPEQPMEWDEACYPIQMSINAATSRATSLSPYMVVFGKAMAVPQAIVYDIPLEDFQEPSKFELKKYQTKLVKYLKTYTELASEKRKKVDSYNKQQYEKLNLQKSHNFQENQLVFIKRSNASRWALPNIGPFIFLKYSSPAKQVAIVKNPATNVISKQSVTNLSPWKIISQDNEYE